MRFILLIATILLTLLSAAAAPTGSPDKKRTAATDSVAPGHKQLDEVTVTATRIKMVMRGDTVVYDAAAFDLEEGSMLETLVRRLPGVTIDGDGVIFHNGRRIKELLVNGK